MVETATSPSAIQHSETFQHIEIEPSGSVDIVWLNVPSLKFQIPNVDFGGDETIGPLIAKLKLWNLKTCNLMTNQLSLWGVSGLETQQ